MKLSEYHIENKSFSGRCRIAVISDLHGSEISSAVSLLHTAKPELILAPGDIFERLDGTRDEINENGFALLSEAARIAPTFLSLGNHEIGGTRSWLPWKKHKPREMSLNDENRRRIASTGARLLLDEYIVFRGIAIGGLTSGALNEGEKPRLDWLGGFCQEERPKILLCHHPEYYKKYLSERDVDLIVSGHAHGGQWRFFGRGVFAPGQGLFPKYTSGIYENRLAVSRGMKKGKIIPRIFNSTEVLLITIN